MSDEAEKKPARKRGRPPYEPTPREREQTRIASGLLGGRLADIALVVGVSVPTLRKYFKQEIAEGLVQANAKVAQSLYKQATDAKKPSVAATIFWLKARCGWSENGTTTRRSRTRTGTAASAKLGKKEEAAAEARGAQKGTEWDEILPGPGQKPPTLQ